MSGSVIAGATAEFASPTGQWAVDITFTKAGSAQFNAFAAKHYRCYAQDPTNPPFCALQAVELGGTVLAAPAPGGQRFPRRGDHSGFYGVPVHEGTGRQARLAGAGLVKHGAASQLGP